MEKFRGKYRVPSARWAEWDYGRDAAYFVTICTARREHVFGAITDGAMTLSVLGQIAADCWQEIPVHFPFVVLDEFVVMPNHVHGILVIDKLPPATGEKREKETQKVETDLGKTTEAGDLASLDAPHINRFGPQSKNLASIVRGYKIGVSKYAGQREITFTWQARYHDRVIRNAGEHERIGQYIRTNPEQWTHDTYYAETPGEGHLSKGNR